MTTTTTLPRPTAAFGPRVNAALCGHDHPVVVHPQDGAEWCWGLDRREFAPGVGEPDAHVSVRHWNHDAGEVIGLVGGLGLVAGGLATVVGLPVVVAVAFGMALALALLSPHPRLRLRHSGRELTLMGHGHTEVVFLDALVQVGLRGNGEAAQLVVTDVSGRTVHLPTQCPFRDEATWSSEILDALARTGAHCDRGARQLLEGWARPALVFAA